MGLPLPLVAVVNHTSALDDAEVVRAVRAVREQVWRHLVPAWHVGAAVLPVPRGVRVPPATWPVYLRDRCAQAGAVGRHERDATPWGEVGVLTAAEAGRPWTAVLSHEVIEVIVNPDCNRYAVHQGAAYRLEPCDPCGRSTYDLSGIEVANFALPSFFRGGPPPWDRLGELAAPLRPGPGGYLHTFDLSGGRVAVGG